MFSLLGVPTDAAYHLVAWFTGILTPVLGGLAAVAAIVAVTVAVRLVLMPLSFRALRGQAVQARLAPQLQALRQRYAKKPEQLQREMSALYKREGTSMFAGFAPLLLQWPLLSVIYLLFRSPRVGGKPNTLLSRDLFGVPLGTHWLSGAGPASAQGAVFLGVFALLAGLCWLSSRLARLMAAPPVAALEPPASARGAKPVAASIKPAAASIKPAAASIKPAAARTKPAAAGTKPAAAGPTPPSGIQGLAKVLPYLTVVIAAFAPLAAGIYLLVSLGWSLAERRLFLRRSAVPSISQVKGA
jgi:YidC/Oxa1 family membrane protein insertase